MLIGHMGGPFWGKKEAAAWSFPKGALEGEEKPLQAALREFEEETGLTPPPPPYTDLGAVQQRSGKTVQLFLAEGDVDLAAFRPGTFPLTLRGRTFDVPELDRVEWVDVPRARTLLVAGQVPFLDRIPLAPAV